MFFSPVDLDLSKLLHHLLIFTNDHQSAAEVQKWYAMKKILSFYAEQTTYILSVKVKDSLRFQNLVAVQKTHAKVLNAYSLKTGQK